MNLSPSKLNLFKDCPRCFWMKENQKIERPRGIFSTLPNGMDGLIKKHFDIYREEGRLPPALIGLIDAVLYPDIARLKVWRHWRSTDLVYNIDDDYTLSGAIDDAFYVPKEEMIIPADYKTRGYPYKNPADALKYYQTQMECYGLMFKSRGFTVSPMSYLIYYIPEIVLAKGMVKFNVSLIPIPIDTDRAVELCLKAIECIKLKTEPDPSEDCGHCAYRKMGY